MIKHKKPVILTYVESDLMELISDLAPNCPMQYCTNNGYDGCHGSFCQKVYRSCRDYLKNKYPDLIKYSRKKLYQALIDLVPGTRKQKSEIKV